MQARHHQAPRFRYPLRDLPDPDPCRRYLSWRDEDARHRAERNYVQWAIVRLRDTFGPESVEIVEEDRGSVFERKIAAYVIDRSASPWWQRLQIRNGPIDLMQNHHNEAQLQQWIEQAKRSFAGSR